SNILLVSRLTPQLPVQKRPSSSNDITHEVAGLPACPVFQQSRTVVTPQQRRLSASLGSKVEPPFIAVRERLRRFNFDALPVRGHDA
ncbi:hypothetical protein, partial [Sphingomonas sp. T1]|uniref:hypothetical protein n=1 Tax=Sphingomonas sp. T1 TaxID=2653172 RepID=UPI001F4578C6